MYGVGETVLYGINGVCRIEDITVKKIGKVSMEYYVLKPVDSGASTLFVPVNNEALTAKMRYVMSKEQISEILSALPEPAEWIENKIQRNESFKGIISKADCMELIALIRAIYDHEKKQQSKGKRLHIADERILKEANKIICSEFSYVLGITHDEVIERILG